MPGLVRGACIGVGKGHVLLGSWCIQLLFAARDIKFIKMEFSYIIIKEENLYIIIRAITNVKFVHTYYLTCMDHFRYTKSCFITRIFHPRSGEMTALWLPAFQCCKIIKLV